MLGRCYKRRILNLELVIATFKEAYAKLSIDKIKCI